MISRVRSFIRQRIFSETRREVKISVKLPARGVGGSQKGAWPSGGGSAVKLPSLEAAVRFLSLKAAVRLPSLEGAVRLRVRRSEAFGTLALAQLVAMSSTSLPRVATPANYSRHAPFDELLI